jgi:hypothetical protein
MPKEKEFDRLGKTPYEEWPDLVTPGEVAALFRVDPKTVGRWGNPGGKIPKEQVVHTVGRHKRYKKQYIYFMFTGTEAPDAEQPGS